MLPIFDQTHWLGLQPFACRYCYYLQGETPVQKMDDATLESFIRRYIAACARRRPRLISSGRRRTVALAGLRFYQKALAP